MVVINQILRYLKITLSKGLMFRKTDRRCTKAYTDSNWAESVAAKNSGEAEYKAMSMGICEEIWLQKVLIDLH